MPKYILHIWNYTTIKYTFFHILSPKPYILIFLTIQRTFSTAGLKILSSKEAKSVYAHTTAAVLRAKDCVMQAVTTVREGADDVYADAKAINDRRAAEAAPEVIEDTASDAE